jgi:trehalose/maltose transport system permease protein
VSSLQATSMDSVVSFQEIGLVRRAWNFLLYSRVLWAWIFLAPTIITLLVVAGRPLFGTFWLSFTDASLLALDDAKFVGFANYAAVLSDPDWWTAVGNTLTFSAFSVALETLLGLGIALVLNSSFRGRGLLRAAVLIPWAVPTVVSAKMWTWMFNDIYGVANHILILVGLLDQPVAWLANPSTTMAALIFVDVWKTTPFMALLILAGLQMVPKDVYEAAKLDCNSQLKTFFAITLPLIKPTIVVAVIFRSLDALRIFDLVYVMAGTKTETSTMSVYARQRLMEFQEFGSGSAASVLIFLFIGFFTVAYLWWFRTSQQEM